MPNWGNKAMAKQSEKRAKTSGATGYTATSPGMVLVGTYKGGQLESWPGFYNYPIREADKIGESEGARIDELRLFNGTKDQRIFRARFLGAMRTSYNHQSHIVLDVLSVPW